VPAARDIDMPHELFVTAVPASKHHYIVPFLEQGILSSLGLGLLFKPLIKGLSNGAAMSCTPAFASVKRLML